MLLSPTGTVFYQKCDPSEWINAGILNNSGDLLVLSDLKINSGKNQQTLLYGLIYWNLVDLTHVGRTEFFSRPYPTYRVIVFLIRCIRDWIRQAEGVLHAQFSPVTRMVSAHPLYCTEIKTVAWHKQACFGHLSISEKTNDTLTYVFDILSYTA